MLRTALRPAIAGFLEDAAIVEVMLNPDSRLWIDRLSSGLTDTGKNICPLTESESSSSWLTTWVPRFIPGARGFLPSCPRRGAL
ncbi:hypothetical protein ACVW1A_000263 [Bradyrhizobium sp. LB1.3]